MKEMVGGCCVCSDERGWPENPLVYCDGSSCTVAVHQACYGIVTVPTGPWFCRKCESNERPTRVRCELCPTKDGALKKTDSSGQGWAHVVCALYIPEVRFGNVTTMEPIILQLIPPERYAKTCYICNEAGKPNRATVGACMQCNKTGCKQQFHVTCAQQKGLLCEEAGNYLDNVKYCGYCSYHYGKLKKGGNVKPIPPYRPQLRDHSSGSDSCSSPEKELEPPASTTIPLALPTSATSIKITTNSTSSTTPSSSSSAPSSATKQRKTSSTTKPQLFATSSATVVGPASTSGMNLSMTNPSLSAAVVGSASGTTSNGGGGVGGGSISISNLTGAGTNLITNPISSKNSSNSSSSASTSSKDKDKHSKGLNKSSSSKDKDKDKDSSSSSSSSKSSSKSKSKDLFIENGQGNVSPAVTSAIGQPIATGANTTSGPPVVFNEINTGNGNGGNGRSSVSSKKRKADSGRNGNNSSDSAVQQLSDCVNNVNTLAFKDIIKDVSVTLVPLPLEKIEMATSGCSANSGNDGNDKTCKKPKTEASTSPNQSGSSPNEPNIQNVNPNPQPPQSTNKTTIPNISTNSSTTVTTVPGSTSPYIQQSQMQTTGASTTPSLYVSVPLSSANVAGINLPSTTTVDSRQSPRNQINSTSASPMIVDHSGSLIQSSRASESPNTTTLNDGGLKISYEKNRINQIQDHEMTSGRRSRTPDSGVFSHGPHPAVASVTAATNQYSNSNGLKFSYEPQIAQGITDDLSVDCRLLPTDMKYSPPSSPGSEAGSSRKRGRKSLDTAKETTNLFTNGGIAPHMLGNQINPASGVSQKLSDQLKMEIQDHSIFTAGGDPPICGVPFPGKLHPRSSLTSNSNSGGNSIASMLADNGPNGSHPQTLEELLERQWENGSRFLMDQAQHFDIATLLSCLYELRTENCRLEDHVNNLKARRDHLLALNARLQIPLSQTAQQNQAATVNNLHLTNGGGVPSSSSSLTILATTTASILTTTSSLSSTASTINDVPPPSTTSYPAVATTISTSVPTSSRNNAQGSRYNPQPQRQPPQQQLPQPPQQPSPLPHNSLVVENGIDYRHNSSQAANHPSSRQHSNSSHSSSSSSQHHHHSRHQPQQFHHHAQPPPPSHHHLPSDHHHMRPAGVNTNQSANTSNRGNNGNNLISSNSSSSGGIMNVGSNGPRGGVHPAEGPTSSYHSAYSHQANQLRRDDNRKEPS